MSLKDVASSDFEILDINDVVNESFKLNEELIQLGAYLKRKNIMFFNQCISNNASNKFKNRQ